MSYKSWYNQDADYNTNAKSYMDYLARHNKFMKVLVEDYEVFKEIMTEEFKQFQLDTGETIESFQSRLDNIQQEMTDLFLVWLEDGTLEEIINVNILGHKIDRDEVTALFETYNLLKVSEKETKIHYFDFNLGYSSKCALVEIGGETILIDTGDLNHSTEAIQKIQNAGITHIDKVIISHYHSDHSGGVQNFIASGLLTSETQAYLPPSPDWNRMKTIGTAGGSTPSDWEQNESDTFTFLNSAEITYTFPNEKQWIDIDEHSAIRFHNTLTQYFEAYYTDLTNDHVIREGIDYNNFSLVTELRNGHKHFVFTGDLGLQGQRQLRRSFDKPIYFYDVEHHGLNYAYDTDFMKQLNPKYVGIQNADKDYAYYSRGSYGYFKALGTPIYITGVNGDILFHDRVDGMTIDTTNKNGSASNGRLHSYSLTGGYNVLTQGTHLDTVTEAGIYVARTLEEVSGVSGLPSVNGEDLVSGFKMIVETYHDSTRIRQTVLENSGRGYIWYRVFSTNDQWNPWFRVSLTRDLFYSRIGEPLPEGTDLNLISQSGKYSAPTNERSLTILNKPDEVTENFTVEVYPLHDSTRFYQNLKVINARNDEYTRVYSNTGYHPWNKVTKTHLG